MGFAEILCRMSTNFNHRIFLPGKLPKKRAAKDEQKFCSGQRRTEKEKLLPKRMSGASAGQQCAC